MAEPLEQQQPDELADLLAERDRLLAENQELRSANHHISTFVNHLTHELRTPLTSITGFSEFLLKNGARQSPEKLRYYCEILFLESSRLCRMVDTLLDLSRLRSGKLGLRPVRCQLDTLAELSLRNLQMQAADKKIEIASVLDRPLPDVLADPDKLQQVLLNLLANALHYSGEGTRVELGARLQDDEVLCWVRDSGIGIALADQAHVFDEFFRVERDSAVKGTGLGLPISRAIVELHGGRIWLESEPGRGSTFYFTVPLAR